MPTAGIAGYRRRDRTRLVATLALGVLAGCTSLPLPPVRATSHAVADVGQTTLGKLSRQGAPPAPLGRAGPISSFRLLPDAAFAFDARISLARNAENTLDVQYYHIANDDVGLLLLRELRDASERGVRVRLLVDDLYTAGEDELFATLDAFPTVEVRLFNPLPSRAGSLEARLLMSLPDFRRINHRMHNKMLLADNSFAVTGGRNIANEYFMRSTAANFIDMDVVSNGPVVREMSVAFDRYWNSEHAWTIRHIVPTRLAPEAAQARFNELARRARPDVPIQPRDSLGQVPVGQEFATGKVRRYWAPARFYADDPDKIERNAQAAFAGSVSEHALAAFGSARRTARIYSPYFIPGPKGMQMLWANRMRGVETEVVTNSLGATDEPLAYAGYERYRAEMLRAGVIIHEIAPDYTARSGHFGNFGKTISRLHGKVAFIDDERIFIGSMNLDHRSATLNTEAGLLIESRDLMADYLSVLSAKRAHPGYRLQLAPDGRRTQWVELDERGANVVHEDIPGEFLWLRLKNWLLLPLVGEELL
ncbi:phospholipase D family protein (plasmid) [Variovorax paradoxus]|nr:phospholipase D family protein [Variovorax paradoxus]